MGEILAGLSVLGTSTYWAAFFASVLMAALAGLVPGLSASLLMALAVPFIVFNIHDPVIGLVMLATIAGVEEALDVLPIVALGYPGAGQVTFLEARPLAGRGYGARVIGFIYVVSAMGGLIGAVALLLIIPIIKPFILQFSFAEIGAIGIFGVSMVGALSRGAMIKGVASGAVGMLLSTIGLSMFTGEARYTFDVLEFREGLPLIATVIGLFALPEMFDLLMTRKPISAPGATFSTAEVFSGAKLAFRYWRLIVRHSLLGVFLGMIPGVGARVVSWLSYGVGISMTRNRAQFGKGSYRGLVFSELVQASKEGGQAIPTLALGIPGGQAWVFVLVAMISYGVSPGPQFLTQHGNIVTLIVVSLILGHAVLAMVGMLWSGQLAKLSRLPYPLLGAVVIPLSILAAFQETRHWSAIPIVLVFAGFGLLMKFYRWPRPPLILGFILGGIVEKNMLSAISLYGVSGVLQRPLTIALLLLSVAIVVFFARIARVERPDVVRSAEAKRSLWHAMSLSLQRPRAPWHWKHENIVGLLYIAIGAGFAYGALAFRPAARVFPLFLGVTVVLLALLQIVKSGWERAEGQVLDIGMMSRGLEGTRRTGFVLLALLALFIVAALTAGLQYGAILFAAVTPLALPVGRRPWVWAVVTGSIMTAFVAGLFERMLNILWPEPLLLHWVQAMLVTG